MGNKYTKALENNYRKALYKIGGLFIESKNQQLMFTEGFKKDFDILFEAIETLEKQKRVLGIIKKKRVDIDLLCDFIEQYGEKSLQTYNGEITCVGMHECILSQEEYDILKEWLNE